MRKNWLDNLRIISVIGVICIHLSSEYFNRYGQIEESTWWVSNFINASSRWSVPVFVMISGALLLGRRYSMREFYFNRARRIITPFVVWVIVYGLLTLVKTSDIDLVLTSIASGSIWFHMWYLYMIIGLLPFVPFLNRFVRSEGLSANEMVALVSLLFGFEIVGWLNSWLLSGLISWLKWFIPFLGYFLAGYYLSRWEFPFTRRKASFILISFYVTAELVTIVANYLACSKYNLIKDNLFGGYSSPTVIVMSISLFLLVKINSREHSNSQLKITLSDACFGVYLIHPFVMSAIRQVIWITRFHSVEWMFLSILVFCSASFMIAIAIRRLPILKHTL